ncbi:hypothetical protein [Desulfosporosinus hippei]|uniref:Uncharacterized protein n=1 Tax=Desulfosporosinus hippei DSM 8344 TaxID=1121419 RepID=A0A1G8FZE1_9FIRM|nr:hypothetical protein [Desulfosporosinus hippei]SDH87507.1 hypothetical protein SAMN05443529_1215 [Desulfosporosinus hippei DSM 8344]
MKDRVYQGFIGGVLGAIVMNLIDWTMYLIGFHQERLFDWASIVVFGRLQSGTGELIFAQIAQVFFSGFIGILFYYLIVNNHKLLFKGWVFSVLVWFFLYGLAIGFELPHLKDRTLLAGISHFISASAFGLTLSYYRIRAMV